MVPVITRLDIDAGYWRDTASLSSVSARPYSPIASARSLRDSSARSRSRPSDASSGGAPPVGPVQAQALHRGRRYPQSPGGRRLRGGQIDERLDVLLLDVEPRRFHRHDRRGGIFSRSDAPLLELLQPFLVSREPIQQVEAAADALPARERFRQVPPHRPGLLQVVPAAVGRLDARQPLCDGTLGRAQRQVEADTIQPGAGFLARILGLQELLPGSSGARRRVHAPAPGQSAPGRWRVPGFAAARPPAAHLGPNGPAANCAGRAPARVVVPTAVAGRRGAAPRTPRRSPAAPAAIPGSARSPAACRDAPGGCPACAPADLPPCHRHPWVSPLLQPSNVKWLASAIFATRVSVTHFKTDNR